MAKKNWILTDAASRDYVESLEITPQVVGGAATGYRIHKCRLQGGLSDGVDVIHVDNGELQFDLLPTRGMGLWKASRGELPVSWNSPVRGPVHPAFVPLGDASGLGWLDGFDELLVRCGLESNGAPEWGEDGRLRYSLHGRIANKPAHRVELHVDDETGEISLHGIVDETRFHFFKLRLHSTVTTRVGQSALTIQDTVENLSDSPASFQLLYHINVGPPLLGPGTELVAPARTVVPRDARAVEGLAAWSRYGAPEPGFAEQVYFCELHADEQQRTQVLLKNPGADRGVSVHYRTDQLPCFTLWKNTTAEADGCVTGLEPATNFPNPRSFEQAQQRVITLAPRARYTMGLTLDIHTSQAEVAAAEQAIGMLSQSQPVIHSQPQPAWSTNA